MIKERPPQVPLLSSSLIQSQSGDERVEMGSYNSSSGGPKHGATTDAANQSNEVSYHYEMLDGGSTHNHSHHNHHHHNHDHKHQKDMETHRVVEENLNLRAAYVHALGDLIQNIGVMIAAALIWWKPQWAIADPICTLIFSAFVVMTTVQIIREATNVLMEGTPDKMDVEAMMNDLLEIRNVSDIHDLHVWSLSVGKPALACHLVIDKEDEARPVLRHATEIIHKKYKIEHTTIQIDFSQSKASCGTAAHSKCHGSARAQMAEDRV